jgi:hypothetical protein
MNENLIEKLIIFWNEFPSLYGSPVSPDLILEAETDLNFSFPEDYKDFLLNFGSGIVRSFPILGLSPTPAMGNDWSVLEETKRFWLDEIPEIKEVVVFSIDLSGNPIGFKNDGTIWFFDHNSSSNERINNNFEDFIFSILK